MRFRGKDKGAAIGIAPVVRRSRNLKKKLAYSNSQQKDTLGATPKVTRHRQKSQSNFYSSFHERRHYLLTNHFQQLRKYQEQADLSKLDKSIYVSIDRLTVLLDSQQSLRRIFRELRHSLDTLLQDFSIQDNLREDTFTLYKMIDEDSINLIFFQLSSYGGYEIIRIDFNPNSLKEFQGLQVWKQIMTYAYLNRLEVRLSRLDLAFDLFNRPEILLLQHIKGGVSHKVFYGRGGNVESKYWGASGSNVQVRLYDKNIEVISHKRTDKLHLKEKPFWWRLEFQLRTKAINDETLDEISKRLENFGFYSLASVPDESKAFAYIFLHAPEMLSQLFPYLKPNTIRVKKTRLRKHFKADNTHAFSIELQEALKAQTPRLNKELHQLIGEFLTLQ